ncbi:MAG: sensor histidine kinase [Angustibacter sp.]
MSGDDLTVLTIAAGSVLVAGVVAHLALRLLRGRGLATLLSLISCTALLAVALAVAVSSRAMFLSAHDTVVVGLTLSAATPLAVVLALWLARQVRRSARTLAATARAISVDAAAADPPGSQTHPRQQPAQPVRSSEPPLISRELTVVQQELVAAGRALRHSRDTERALEASRRELVAWISHDLRTPLAGIRAMAEALEDGVVDDPHEYHRQLRVEAERLATMVDSLFLLSRLHTGALSPAREQVDLGDLVSDAVASVAPTARVGDVAVQGSCGGHLLAPVDPGQITRALLNLLVNGVRHTPPGGRVEVTARRVADGIRLTVQDGCGGIPDDELPRVFDVAWRGRSARSSGPDGGGGLGLAVTRGIALAHGGSVAVVNTGPGCRFEIHLPS